MTSETNVDERPLRERFRSLEHPPELPDWGDVLARAEPAPRRTRLPVFALAAALALAAVAGAVAIAVLTSEAETDNAAVSATGEPLRPLPPGPPSAGPGIAPLVEHVTLEEMIVRADVVFVGAVEAIGGSEPGTPVSDPALTTHRVRFRVERPLRGVGEGLVDITEFDNISLSWGIKYAPGDRYLVFAEFRRLGGAEAPALVPVGYMQGVYRMTGDDTAENEANGAVKLSELEKRLAG